MDPEHTILDRFQFGDHFRDFGLDPLSEAPTLRIVGRGRIFVVSTEAVSCVGAGHMSMLT